MDTETTEVAEDSFAVLLGKSFLMSAATTAGFVGGLFVVGAVKDRLERRRRDRNTIETPEED